MKFQTILGIETSCDETAAAVLANTKDGIKILSNVVASSKELQAKYGGIIPEQAAREQIKAIIPVVKEAIHDSQLTIDDIDAIAVTQGPGLIGSLLVGVETAKTLSWVWGKPLIPVNHLIGHFYANWISKGGSEEGPHASTAVNEMNKDALWVLREDLEKSTLPKFPCLGLLISGGHTDIVLFKDHVQYTYIGGTRDDAAGECFDKCARLLRLPYPGGPEIAKLAKDGNPKAFRLPRPMINSADFDLSFSGLKTAVSNLVNSGVAGAGKARQDPLTDLCASVEQAIVDCLIHKTIKAAQKFKVSQIMVAGGVASNQKLITDLKLKILNCKLKIKLYVPPPHLCTDNAAMIASASFFQKPLKNPLQLDADPNLSLAY